MIEVLKKIDIVFETIDNDNSYDVMNGNIFC